MDSLPETVLIDFLEHMDHDSILQLWKSGVIDYVDNPNSTVWEQLLVRQYPNIFIDPTQTFRDNYIWAQAHTRLIGFEKQYARMNFPPPEIHTVVSNSISRNWLDVVELYIITYPTKYNDILNGIRTGVILLGNRKEYRKLVILVKILSNHRNISHGKALRSIVHSNSIYDERLLSQLELSDDDLSHLPFLYNAMSVGSLIPFTYGTYMSMTHDMLDYIHRMIKLYPALILYSEGTIKSRTNVSVFWMACMNYQEVGIDTLSMMLFIYPDLIHSKTNNFGKEIYVLDEVPDTVRNAVINTL